MKSLLRRGEFWFVVFIIACLGFIYRGVLFGNQVIFPTQFLASFYSPWATLRYPEYPNGLPHKPIGGNDQVRMFYPYRTFTNESIQRGELPLWNPYNFAGSPLLANFQSAVFYPLNIFYLIFPQITAWSLLVFIQPILGTLFMYIYLRHFALHKLAAYLGAISFGFSGFIITWSMENAVVGQAALWFPLILYSVDLFIKRVTVKRFILLVSVLATCLIAGHLQTFFFIYLTGFCYGLFRIVYLPKSVRFYYTALLFSSFVTAILLCSVQILPSIEAFSQSTRGSATDSAVLKNYLIPVTHFVTAIAPDIYGNPGAYNYFGSGFYHEQIFYLGVIPLIFALFAGIWIRKNGTVLFFSITALLSFFFSVSSPFTEWFYRQPIPLISTFTPSRILFVTSTALSVMAGFGFHLWLTREDKKYSRTAMVTTVFVGLLLVFFIGYFNFAATVRSPLTSLVNSYLRIGDPFTRDHFKLAVRNSILPLAMIGFLIPAVIFYSRIRAIAIIVVVIASQGQFYFMNKYVVLGDKKFLFPDNFVISDISNSQGIADRFLSFGLPILGDFGTEKGLYSPDGIDPVFSNRYGQLVYAAKMNGRIIRNIPRIEVNLSEYAENTNIYDNERRQKLISLLGVKTVFNYEKEYKDLKVLPQIFPPNQYRMMEKKDGWQKYVNISAYPRAFFVDSAIIKRSDQEIADAIFDVHTNLRKTVILEEKSPVKASIISAKDDQIKFNSYTPQKIVMTVDADRDRILVLSDVYYPGWIATVDGKQTRILRADYAFRSIAVPQGKHKINFIYRPESFRLGAVISLATLLFLGTGYFIVSKRITAKPLNSF